MTFRLHRLLAPTAAVAVLAALLAAPAVADPAVPEPQVPAMVEGSAPELPRSQSLTAKQALRDAKELFDGDGESGGRHATLVLRDLAIQGSELTGADRTAAQRLLARPTDGAGDIWGDGYTVGEQPRLCGEHVCVHYVATTPDAATPSFAATALDTLEHVHETYVAAGYRPPAPDGSLGGDAKTDIYLADLGDDALYGYCAPDSLNPPTWHFPAFCVLDNDFAKSQFPTNTPVENLRVTAAHEYFHAVQFAYDGAEDGWFMEATATWAEDELYNTVNDNRQYLKAGQLGNSLNPLDWHNGSIHYGNWIFFRYLSERFPKPAPAGMPTIVRAMWRYADAAPGGQDLYSIEAVEQALADKKQSFTKTFAHFSAVNRYAKKYYDEGKAYPQAKAKPVVKLGKRQGVHSSGTWQLHHLSSTALTFKPRQVTGKIKLKITVDMAARATGPAVVVDQVTKKGKHVLKYATLKANGKGSVSVPFANNKTSKVIVTFVNASTRFTCWQGSAVSCQGNSPDDNLPFTWRASVGG